MEEIKLDVQIRQVNGKKGIAAVKREECVPAIVYGEKEAATAVKVERKLFEKLMRQHHGQSVIFHLNVMEAEKKVRDYSALLKEAQRDPVSNQLVHLDFQRISATHEIHAKVVIESTGVPAGLKQGGSLEHSLWDLEVICLPKDLPQKIMVDVSALEMGQAIHVKDIQLPSGVKTKHDLNAIVFALVHSMREEVVAEVEEATAKEPEVAKEKKDKEPAAKAPAAKK